MFHPPTGTRPERPGCHSRSGTGELAMVLPLPRAAEGPLPLRGVLKNQDTVLAT